MNHFAALQKLEARFRRMMAEDLENSEVYYETFWEVLGEENIDFEIERDEWQLG
jgi:hypothetical protein